jgi:hypothetical protein
MADKGDRPNNLHLPKKQRGRKSNDREQRTTPPQVTHKASLPQGSPPPGFLDVGAGPAIWVVRSGQVVPFAAWFLVLVVGHPWQLLEDYVSLLLGISFGKL